MRFAAFVGMGFAGACVSVLGVGEDDLERISAGICQKFNDVCEDPGTYPGSLVWGDKTCVQVIEATVKDGTTAEDLGECLVAADCLELMACFEDRGVFEELEQPACKGPGERCLEVCFEPNCKSPERCCDQPCSAQGTCQ